MKKTKTKSTPPTREDLERHLKRKEEGRPSAHSKLTNKVQEKVCGFIAGGLRIEDACALSGIHRSTLWVWKDKGAAGEERYKEFVEAVELAETKSKALLVGEIRRDPDWKAKKWLLMNRFPKEFRDHYTQEVTGPDGSPIAVSMNPFIVNVSLSSNEPETEFTTINHQNGEVIQ